jgi:hypothetical protein
MTVALVAEQAGRIIPQFCLIVDVRNTLVDTAVLALSESGFSDPWWHPGRWYSAFLSRGQYICL